jgi:hypothetical protein
MKLFSLQENADVVILYKLIPDLDKFYLELKAEVVSFASIHANKAPVEVPYYKDKWCLGELYDRSMDWSKQQNEYTDKKTTAYKREKTPMLTASASRSSSRSQTLKIQREKKKRSMKN